MEKQRTSRGFAYYEFKDNHGNKCSLQKSSNIEPCIWLGANDIDLRGFIPYGNPSWRNISLDQLKTQYGMQDIIANNRVELSVEIVKELLPILQKFVETEEI
jgi:hypothetical protein